MARPRWLLLPVPKFLPLLSAMEWKRSFEGSSPPSQPQVRGVLVQHWNVWQSYGAEGWTVEILHHGYRVPFHRFPPVSGTSGVSVVCPGVGAGSCSQGEGLQDASEGSSGMFRPARSRVFSCLFMVQKAMGGWRPVYLSP